MLSLGVESIQSGGSRMQLSTSVFHQTWISTRFKPTIVIVVVFLCWFGCFVRSLVALVGHRIRCFGRLIEDGGKIILRARRSSVPLSFCATFISFWP